MQVTSQNDNLVTQLWQLCKKYQFSIIVVIFIATTLRIYLGLILTKELLQLFVDKLIDHTFSIQHEFWLIILYVICTSSGALLRLLSLRLQFNLDAYLRQDVKDYLFRLSLQHSVDFFTNVPSGELSSKISSVISSLAIIFRDIAEIFASIVITIILAYKFLQIDPSLAISFIIWLIIYAIFATTIFKHLHQNYRKVAALETGSIAKINDCFMNISNIKIFAREKFEQKNIKREEMRILRQQSYGYKLTSLLHLINLIMIPLICFIMFIISIKLLFAEIITVGTFTFITATVVNVAYIIRGALDFLVETTEQTGKIRNSFGIFNQPQEINNAPNARNIQLTSTPEIVFQQVNFSYNSQQVLFQDFSLHIPAGQKLAIVGATGGGKTTFIKLLLRLYDIQSGSIRIDNYDISTDFTQESLRQNISYIPQDPVLFHRSLKENITYGCNGVNMDEVIIATKQANCYDFIMQTEQQFDTIVGERGLKLSSGQRQRIAIARAILKNSRILILDEATSALDSITENYIQQSMDQLMRDKTVIAIAHRLSTLNHMDRIVVIANGTIIEDGSIEDLLQKPEGVFKRMWSMQHNDILNWDN